MSHTNRLKELRKNKGITQKQMSKDLDIPQNTLSNYENGNRNPTVVTWNALADYFGVPVAYLQGYSDYKELDLVDPEKHKLVNDDGTLTKDGLDNIRKSILSEEQRQSDSLSVILKAYLPDIDDIPERVDQNISRIEDRLLISDLIHGVADGLISLLVVNEGIGSHHDLLRETADELKEISDKLSRVAFEDEKAYETKKQEDK